MFLKEAAEIAAFIYGTQASNKKVPERQKR